MLMKHFTFDKEKTAQGVYGTTDTSHPGVSYTMSMKDYLVGGKIDYIQRPNDTEIRKCRLTPKTNKRSICTSRMENYLCISN